MPRSITGPIGPVTGPRASVSSTKGARSTVGAVQRDHTERDPGHRAASEVVEPTGIHPCVVGRAALLAAVARPGLGIPPGVLDLAQHHPGVDPGALSPGPDPIAPVAAVADLPVGEDLGDASGLEVLTEAGNERLDRVVTVAARIAVFVGRHVRIARVITKGGLLTISPEPFSRNGFGASTRSAVPTPAR